MAIKKVQFDALDTTGVTAGANLIYNGSSFEWYSGVYTPPSPLSVTFDGTTTNYSSGNSFYLYYQSNNYYTLAITSGTAVTFHLWGASGGGGKYSSSGYSGSGGLVYGTYTPTSDVTAYLYIGQGGDGADSSSFAVGGDGGWPNGGYGTRGDATGSGGGGMSMLSLDTFDSGNPSALSSSNILLIAGAGGGATGYAGSGGDGGGTTGSDGGSGITGGSQSAGGTNNGSYLTGGNATGIQADGSDDGGGGGGGYYGGGGGTSDAKPGAGGSGYINATSAITSSGFVTYDNASGAGGPDRNSLRTTAETTNSASYAQARQSSTAGGEIDGFNGLVHISIA